MRDLDGLDGARVHAQQIDVAVDAGRLQRIDRALCVLLQRQGPRRRVGEAIAQAIRRMGRPLQTLLQHLPHGAGTRRHVQQHQRHAFALVAAQVHLPEAGRIDAAQHQATNSLCASKNDSTNGATRSGLSICSICPAPAMLAISMCGNDRAEMPPACRRLRVSPGDPTPRPPASAGARAAPASTLRHLRACTGSDSPSDGAGRRRGARGRPHRAYPRPLPQTPLAPPRIADSESE